MFNTFHVIIQNCCSLSVLENVERIEIFIRKTTIMNYKFLLVAFYSANDIHPGHATAFYLVIINPHGPWLYLTCVWEPGSTRGEVPRLSLCLGEILYIFLFISCSIHVDDDRRASESGEYPYIRVLDVATSPRNSFPATDSHSESLCATTTLSTPHGFDDDLTAVRRVLWFLNPSPPPLMLPDRPLRPIVVLFSWWRPSSILQLLWLDSGKYVTDRR